MRRQRYTCDQGFFDAIDGEAKAYWLGFIAADGNIYKRTLCFGLAPMDGAHLQGFITAVGGTQIVTTRVKVDGHSVSTLKVNSVRLVTALARYGVVPRKSLILEWPDLPAEAVRHFLRGYLDGDGSWHQRASRTGRPSWTVSAVGAEHFMTGAASALRLACDLKALHVERLSTPGLVRMVYAGNRQVSRIAHYLYDGATVYLPRKAARAQEAIAEAGRTVSGWAAHPEGCTRCGTTSRRYFAKGLCAPCYQRQWYASRN